MEELFFATSLRDMPDILSFKTLLEGGLFIGRGSSKGVGLGGPWPWGVGVENLNIFARIRTNFFTSQETVDKIAVFLLLGANGSSNWSNLEMCN